MAPFVKHCGREFDIGHLDPHVESCAWKGAKGEFSCHVKISYSNHRYSFETGGFEQPEAAYVFNDRHGKERVFCPIRHIHSQELPKILRDLCLKPNQQIARTPEHNWTIYRLAMPSPLEKGEMFWVFFRLKLIAGERGKPIETELFVESAYPRNVRPITGRRSFFGRAVEEA